MEKRMYESRNDLRDKPSDNRNIKVYGQFGILSVLLLLPMLILIGTFFKSGFSTDPVATVKLFLIATFFIFFLIFYQMTIRITNDSISFSLGIGLVGKTYKISEIRSCKAVKNSVFNGIGIRMLSNGWLYGVSGLKAVELQFNDRKSVVRLGTNKPEEIAELVNSLIDQKHPVSDDSVERKRLYHPVWIIVVMLALLPVTMLISGKQETKIYADQQGLTIEGTYGMAISYPDMIKVDTISSLPPIRIRTNGYAMGKTKIGNFRLADDTNVKLFVRAGYPPYIVIHSKDNKPVYINFEDRNRTIDLYNDLIKNLK